MTALRAWKGGQVSQGAVHIRPPTSWPKSVVRPLLPSTLVPNGDQGRDRYENPQGQPWGWMGLASRLASSDIAVEVVTPAGAHGLRTARTVVGSCRFLLMEMTAVGDSARGGRVHLRRG